MVFTEGTFHFKHSHLGSPGSTSSGLGLGFGVHFRRLRPILFSIFSTRALTDVLTCPPRNFWF